MSNTTHYISELDRQIARAAWAGGQTAASLTTAMLTQAVANWVRVASSSWSCIFFSSFLSITSRERLQSMTQSSSLLLKLESNMNDWAISDDVTIINIQRRAQGKKKAIYEPLIGKAFEWLIPCHVNTIQIQQYLNGHRHAVKKQKGERKLLNLNRKIIGGKRLNN